MALLILFIILLATLLATRKKRFASSTSTRGKYYDNNITIFAPVSVAYAFYSFDYNVLDLYSIHDGQVKEGIENYIPCYVGAGGALILNESYPIWISIANSFNLRNTSFTIEPFIFPLNNSINANLVQFSSGISININMNYLEFIKVDQNVKIYLDGRLTGQSSYITQIDSENGNITMTIGSGYNGIIDQLSISYEAKTSDRLLWNATVLGYYPLDGGTNSWLLDYGPNCQNATSEGTQAVHGFRALDISSHAFSVALWIRPENQSGVFLTITSPMACFIVLDIGNSDNHIVAYLPNAINTSVGVNIIGSSMNIGTASQGRADTMKLNNGYGESMTVTLRMYHGTANCIGGNGLDVTKPFIGSLDELYIFSRELQQNEIEKLNSTTNF
ncbi:unnamed protein product [Rotaria sp. Silwood1]|nr:unnamed protein product [Rotaria sp. Silwood1]CAF1626406.1 unnamed protein product [Rotaria sp. Silwood1]CAF3797335.1 unnamed protein product [Rotaria sp. Silwood1]CAF4613184.1 unnamed protein product [Rotaria sp. Silwood1]